jgi:formyl-CoA transferase
MGQPLRGTFATSEGGWIAISASTPRQQQAVGELAAGQPGDTLRARTAAWLATVPSAAAAAALIAARVPATPVHDLAQMAADPHIAHRVSLDALGGATVVRPTPAIDRPPHAATLPQLGDANVDVLGGWLGMTPGEITRLQEQRDR